jgi:4-hydroxy-tetrahydrodipicolinate synthase
MAYKRLEGVIVPLLTPFAEDGTIDVPTLQQLVESVIAAGVQGVMVAGTTGEGPMLSLAERMLLAEIVVAQVRKRVAVIVQSGAITTHETLVLAEHATTSGADAIAVMSPFFYAYSQAALIGYFCTIADHVPSMPVYLYNIPQRTGNVITPEVSAAVAQRCANVVGEKESSGNLQHLAAKQQIRNGIFVVLLGSDGLMLPGLALGASGVVSGNANVVPELVVALYQAFQTGDLPAARAAQTRLDTLIGVLGDGCDLGLFKALLRYRGIAAGKVRSPLPTPAPAVVEQAYQHLLAAEIALV